MFQNRYCLCAADALYFREGFDGCFPHPGDTSESRKQCFFAGFADARDVVKEAFGNASAQEEFVVAVGDAMGLVADALEEAQGAGVLVESHGE